MITKQKPLSRKDIEELLQKQTKTMESLLLEQTDVILSAVDEKLARSGARVNAQIASLEKKLALSEMRTNAKIDKLINTIDKFLKRLTDTETEFEMMKADLNRIKRVIKEKLGVALS